MTRKLNKTLRDELLQRHSQITGFDTIDTAKKLLRPEGGDPGWCLSLYDDGKDEPDTYKNYMHVGSIDGAFMLSQSVHVILRNLIQTELMITFHNDLFDLGIARTEHGFTVTLEDWVTAGENDEISFDNYEDAEKEFIDTLLTQLREEF